MAKLVRYQAGGPGPDDDVNPRRGCPRSLAFGDRRWKPRRGLLSRSVRALKLPVSMRSQERPFWQAHSYDFNVSAHARFVEKLRTIHRNPGSLAHELCARGWKPVRRGLVEEPEDSRHPNGEDPSSGTPEEMVERSPLSDRYGRNRRDRIRVDSPRERLATARVDALPAVRLLLPGPQKRATGGTLNLIEIGMRLEPQSLAGRRDNLTFPRSLADTPFEQPCIQPHSGPLRPPAV